MRARLISILPYWVVCRTSTKGIFVELGTFLNIQYMSNFNNFREFLYFYKSIAYVIALGYILLITIIVILSIIINDQSRTIIYLQNGIIENQSSSYIDPPIIDGLLNSEYRVFMISCCR